MSKKKYLSETHLHLLAEWDYTKNGNLRPGHVTYGSGKKVWWKCRKCRYSWKVSVSNRSGEKNTGCLECSRGNVSKISQKWLDSLGVPKKYREFIIKKLGIRVDAYVPETNTVYEFLGDFWHGNPKIFPPEKLNRVNKKTFGELYEVTLKRLKLLKLKGYNVVYIWENDYSKSKESMNSLTTEAA